MVKKVGKYEIGKTLGEGTFGKVKFAINTETQQPVAIKILEKQKIVKQGMVEQIKKEIAIMKLVNHGHVVNLLDVLASATKIYMVLELVTGGELFYKLAHDGRFTEEVARKYFQQLVCGLEYCHAQGVAHRDLKPENVLLDENMDLKISDFGLSALHEGDSSEQLLHTTCGTPNYVAPEVISDRGYSGFTADVWSCGVMLYVFLAGFLPFEDSSTDALFKKIQRAEYKFPPWFSDDAKDLIYNILVPDPDARMTVADIKIHPWFTVDLDPAQMDMSPAIAVDDADLEFDDVIEVDDGPEELKITNAFDLIGKTGAFDLTRILDRNPDTRIKRYTRFTSAVVPDDILAFLQSVFATMPVTTKLVPNTYAIKVNAPSSKGLVTFVVKIYEMKASLFMVDFQKGKGDILEFSHLYREVKEKSASIICEK